MENVPQLPLESLVSQASGSPSLNIRTESIEKMLRPRGKNSFINSSNLFFYFGFLGWLFILIFCLNPRIGLN